MLVFHVLLAISLIALILIQHGRGADAGAAFGSGASSTVFGARGSASFLSRATAILATLFFVISLALAILANRQAGRESVTDLAAPPAAEAPARSGQADTDVPTVEPGAGTDVPDVPLAPAAQEGGAGQ